jgi:hypothetical protein
MMWNGEKYSKLLRFLDEKFYYYLTSKYWMKNINKGIPH